MMEIDCFDVKGVNECPCDEKCCLHCDQACTKRCRISGEYKRLEEAEGS